MYYQSVIDQFTVKCKEVFSSLLTGVYWSIAMDCFNPEKSDIDLLIIVENNITNAQKITFMEHAVELNEQGPIMGLEFSIVKRKYCNPFVYQRPLNSIFLRCILNSSNIIR